MWIAHGTVRRMCFPLLRECEWLLRGHADGTETEWRRNGYGRMFNNRFYLICFFLCFYGKYTEEQTHVGNAERGVVILRRIRMWYFVFYLYTCLYR